MSKNNQESGQDFFEKYLESLESSSVIDPMSFVMQCPPEVRPELISAFAAIEAALQFHDEEVSVTPEECLQLNETLASLKRREELVKRSEATGLTYREVLFEDARQRLASAKELFRVQPVECMAESLNFGGVANRIGTLYRDSQGRKRNATSLGIDVTWIRSREDALRSEAESLLRSANALAEPINLDSVAHYIGVLVEKAPLDSNFSMEGCLVTDGVVCGIIINTNPALGTLERHRYTLGHEIGHATLHKESGINVFQDTDSELRNYSDFRETEANIFASALVMPPTLLRNFYNPAYPPHFASAHILVNTFKVSYQAALHRLVRDSQHPCSFVCVHRGRIQWWVASDSWEGYLSTGDAVPSNSQAWEYAQMEGKGRHSFRKEGQLVSTWVRKNISYEVLDEESYRMNENFVYTLLTLK